MVLSNWLTREEWNACYFLGVFEIFELNAPFPDLGSQLRFGIGYLHRAGYEFKGITSSAEGDYTKVSQCCRGNESCLAEIIEGSFDTVARAREFHAWAQEHPELNLPIEWLEQAFKERTERLDEN